eukprot:TRINITY_DN192_c0_g2_i1.p1 TRINITY_DN192_c0_g2~~TRINITY_DN192_c0_g2_i1.p1  ORF type:complete len:341 (-),score=52.32 TRINITY_DN192_c0_g2_i1:151-1173(-)
MEALGISSHHHPLHLSLLHRAPSFSKPLSSIHLKTTPLTFSKTKTLLKASHLSPIPPKTSPSIQNHSPKPLSSLLKTTYIAVTTAALFFARLQNPSLAAPVAQPTVIETTELSEEEKEKTLEEYLDSHPDDVDSLRALMEVKIKARKLTEAVDVIDRLILLEPLENEWPLMRSHLLSYSGDAETAKLGFEEILSKNPLAVEAYHGLVMAASQSDSDELEHVLKRIEDAMERCKKEKKKSDLRDFKLLVAQVRVIQGKYNEALKVYEELVKEEPRDFRPYLCQGIIYTLLRKKDEAEKQFQKYRRLIPKGHPYAQYFDENMIATKVFSQMPENQRTNGLKS